MSRSYLSQRLTRPLRTKDGGTLRTGLDARRYMLQLSKDREEESGRVSQGRCRRFQQAIELALVYDGKLDVTRME